MSDDTNLKILEEKLASLDTERAKLILEINTLRNDILKDRKTDSLPTILGRGSLSTTPQTPQEKIDLFLKLFRCREDVYPKRWENSKTGKQGYSPVCDLEWVKPICQKPTIRCSDCQHQKFPPLDSFAVESHLKGHTTIGTYAIRTDDTCSFLACDFDESSWKEDILAYKQAAREIGIEKKDVSHKYTAFAILTLLSFESFGSESITLLISANLFSRTTSKFVFGTYNCLLSCCSVAIFSAGDIC